jgi:hypothetical protein
MMRKKHFIELADVIRAENEWTTPASVEASEGDCGVFSMDAIHALADFCARQNPRFNRERWLGYIAGECGKNGGPVPPCARAMGCLCALHARSPKSRKACDTREVDKGRTTTCTICSKNRKEGTISVHYCTEKGL